MTQPTPNLRCICGDPVEEWTGPGEGGWIHSPGSDTSCLNARPRCPHCGLPHDLTPGGMAVRLCERARSPEWQASIAPRAVTQPDGADTLAQLRQRIADELHAAGGPFVNADADTLAAAVLAVVQPEMAELADYRNRITWETNCGEHARLLDASYAETARAEEAEAALARVRELHRKASNGDTCVYCAHGQRLGYDTTWPCDTIRALTAPSPPAP